MQDKIKELGEIALGSRLKRLSDKFMSDVGRIYRLQDSEFEPRWFTFTHLLYDNGPMSVLDIASSLKITHPAVIQFVEQMSRKKLIAAVKDEKDKRKKIVRLTEKGREVFDSIKPSLEVIEKSVREMISSTGYDILHVVESLERAVNEKDLFERTVEKLKAKLMEKVEVVKFKPELRNHFKILNKEWLDKHFKVEPEDEKMLSNPEEIIKHGGEIFFAKYNDEIVGTCAAIKIDDETYELAKMAVTEKAQGKQIGKKLGLVVIGFAISNGAKQVVLETARKLSAAVNLYERLGFIYVPFDRESKYSRTTVMMKLQL